MKFPLSFESIARAIFRRLIQPPVLDLSLLGVALAVACWGMKGLIRGYPAETAVWASLWGVALAWWAFGRLGYRSVAGILLFILGFFMVFIQAGSLMNTLLRSMVEAVQTGWVLIQNLVVQLFWNPAPPPVIIEIPESWFNLISGLVLVWGRFTNWLDLFFQNRPFYDEAAVAVWWSGAAWIFAWWAGAALRRGGGPLVAVVPSGVLLIALLNRNSGDARLLLPYTGAVLALLSSNNYFGAKQRWVTRRLDLPDTLGLDTSVWAGAVLVVVLASGFFVASLPALTVETLRQMTDQLRPGDGAGKPAADALGVQHANQLPTPPTRIGRASLPRQHLIGAGPELSQQLAFYAKILNDSGREAQDEIPGSTVELYYLRGLVYDVYLHAGWASSPSATQIFPGGEAIQAIDSAAANPRQIEQQVTLAPTRRNMVFVSGDVLAVSEEVEVSWRAAPSGTKDVFGLGIAKDEYSAWSFQAQASAIDLRQASQDYPDWVRQRYLQLPDGIPGRVIELAATFTHAPTAFDKAAAIESHLRTITYTLDIPEPPIGQDIVDYFLFDLQRGYCDYFASAMVVLARLNGLPARLVIGYVASNYDPANERYVVTEDFAHSWVEIYFPGYGWIPFEPTSGLSALRRAEVSAHDSPIGPTPVPPDWLSGKPFSLSLESVFLLLSLTALGLLIIIQLYPLFDHWQVAKDGPSLAITRLYRRYERFALRVAGPQPTGRTPFEMVGILKERLLQLRWPLRRASANTQAAAEELTTLYVQTAYAPEQRTPADLRRAWQLWHRLQRSSFLLTIFRHQKVKKGKI